MQQPWIKRINDQSQSKTFNFTKKSQSFFQNSIWQKAETKWLRSTSIYPITTKKIVVLTMVWGAILQAKRERCWLVLSNQAFQSVKEMFEMSSAMDLLTQLQIRSASLAEPTCPLKREVITWGQARRKSKFQARLTVKSKLSLKTAELTISMKICLINSQTKFKKLNRKSERGSKDNRQKSKRLSSSNRPPSKKSLRLSTLHLLTLCLLHKPKQVPNLIL